MPRLNRLHSCFLKMNGKQFRISKITKFEYRPRIFCIFERELPYCCSFEYSVAPRKIIQEELFTNCPEKHSDFQKIFGTKNDVEEWNKIINKVHSELDKEIVSVEQSNADLIKELMES